MKYLSLLTLIFFASSPLFAQDTIPEENVNQRIIEDVVEQLGEEEDFDFNAQFEQLNAYLKKPIHLNKATALDLADLGLLTPQQVNQFIMYRQTVGDLIAIEELQAIPTFDLVTIERILPYVRIRGDKDDFQVPFREMLRAGKHTILIRANQLLETQKGYLVNEETGETPFVGSPTQFYTRYRYNYENRLSYGITMEKDAGEDFFGEYNPYGFDYYSAHFYVKNLNRHIKALAIGDFEAKFGQGLVMWSGFGTGKSSFVMNTKRIGRTIRPYASVNEFAFLRGAGGTFALTDDLEISTFVSFKNRDANISNIDTFENEILEISSLQTSGLHRTINEINDEAAIQEFIVGGKLKYNFSDAGYISGNVLFTQLSAPLVRTDAPANIFRFQDSVLVNGSLDYSYVFRNFNFYGETAISDNGGWATLNGVLISLGRTIDLSILHRNFQPNYHALYTNVFAETSGTQNEKGTYIGLNIKPNRKWQYAFYFDSWQHPWLRFQANAPSKGYEYFTQITYAANKSTQVYFRFRDETKQQNAKDEFSNTNYLADNRKINTRLHFQHKFTKALTWRSRIEMVHFKNKNGWQQGWMMYQDLNYAPMGQPFSFSTRYALYDTDNYDTRIYAFENDLLNSFSVPPYYYQGNRFYLNVTYRVNKTFMLQARFAQTVIFNQSILGSGNTEIKNNRRTNIKIQARFNF